LRLNQKERAMAEKFDHEDLVQQLKSPGWRLSDNQPDKTVTGTLSDVLTESHARKAEGQTPGVIKQIETAIELDMLQIEMLWRELGLPTI
jgi:hypothetical protein